MEQKKEFVSQINFFGQCRKYNIPLWQCPPFLFFVLGLVILVSSIVIYAIGTKYIDDPGIVALIVLIITAFLIVVDFSITKSFERLAEASRMKSEFISIVSHQLRSPLANLKWTIDLLFSGKVEAVSEKQLAYFEILRDNSSRMSELISDLLAVSRLEGEGPEFKKEEIHLAELIRKAVNEFRPLSQASNVEIALQLADDLPTVLIDPFQINQAFTNLFDNAIRYVKDHGRVQVNLFRKNRQIRCEIKDNGMGIPLEDQSYLFQKFFRGGNAYKQQPRGSGLGLFIAKAIIEKSGGKIGFVSKEGEGSTFWFTLPIK